MIKNSDLQYFRFFNLIFVMRLIRLLRYLKYTEFIINIINKTLIPFLSIGFMLFLILFVYSLLGEDIFKKKLNHTTFKGQEFNFQSFESAFFTCFNLINLNDWYDFVIFSSLYSLGLYSVIFCISLMILGNFIILNLFIAIMLDGFENLTLEGAKEDFSSAIAKYMYPQIFEENKIEEFDEKVEVEQKIVSSNYDSSSFKENCETISESCIIDEKSENLTERENKNNFFGSIQNFDNILYQNLKKMIKVEIFSIIYLKQKFLICLLIF